jgi:hypothetical protein
LKSSGPTTTTPFNLTTALLIRPRLPSPFWILIVKLAAEFWTEKFFTTAWGAAVVLSYFSGPKIGN